MAQKTTPEASKNKPAFNFQKNKNPINIQINNYHINIISNNSKTQKHKNDYPKE